MSIRLTDGVLSGALQMAPVRPRFLRMLLVSSPNNPSTIIPMIKMTIIKAITSDG